MSVASAPSHILSADTQATLLLCGSFGKGDNGPKPLATKQYNRVVEWLVEQAMRPGDLLTPEGQERLERASSGSTELGAARLLLQRGAAMALAVEAWTNQGLWVIGRGDVTYPNRLKQRLGRQAPPILYGTGEPLLLAGGGLAVVGSRNAEAIALEVTRLVASSAAHSGIQVISGAARGVDQEAMLSAIDEGGYAVGILAGDLAKTALLGRYREALRAGRLVLISPYHPNARFTIGNAMGRNRYIYTLSDWALVMSASAGGGGTWAGATENLKHKWVPLFVYDGEGASEGNRRLLALGARPFHIADIAEHEALRTLLGEALLERKQPQPVQGTLFAASSLTTEAEGQQAIMAIREPKQPINDTVGRSEADILWQQHIWPLLSAILQEETTDRELAARLGLELSQAKAWLKRAMLEGKAKRLARPVRYVSVGQGDSLMVRG